MEEDFLFLDDDEDDLCFDLNTVDKTSTFLHITNVPQNQQALHMLGEMQVKQAELKRKNI